MKETRLCATLRDALLLKLLSGEMRVKDMNRVDCVDMVNRIDGMDGTWLIKTR